MSSCSKNEPNTDLNNEDKYVNPNVLGIWKLIEVQVDYSSNETFGQYETVDSERTIEFFENGTFITNGTSRHMSITIGDDNGGEFNSTNGTLDPYDDCYFDEWGAKIKFRIEDSLLIIGNTSCVEGCGKKFEKLTLE